MIGGDNTHGYKHAQAAHRRTTDNGYICMYVCMYVLLLRDKNVKKQLTYVLLCRYVHSYLNNFRCGGNRRRVSLIVSHPSARPPLSLGPSSPRFGRFRMACRWLGAACLRESAIFLEDHVMHYECELSSSKRRVMPDVHIFVESSQLFANNHSNSDSIIAQLGVTKHTRLLFSPCATVWERAIGL